MAINLFVVDAESGSGGTANVTGSNAASSNTLYKAPWTGQTGELVWSLVGSRTGDGTIAISSAPGFFLFRLDNLLSGVTTVVANYQPLTDGEAESIYYRAMNAIKTRIDGLAMTDAPAAEVCWLPRFKQADSTVIAVFPATAETFPGVMTATDDIGLPICVAIIDPSNQNRTSNLNRNLLWREKILSALRYQRLAGVSEGMILEPEPAQVVDPRIFDENQVTFSALFFRLRTRTERG